MLGIEHCLAVGQSIEFDGDTLKVVKYNSKNNTLHCRVNNSPWIWLDSKDFKITLVKYER
jgi:hypothetical protein